jgi:hypothetical protein
MAPRHSVYIRTVNSYLLHSFYYKTWSFKASRICSWDSTENPWFLCTEHYRWFDWHLSGNGQNGNFGFWNFFLAQIIADYVYFHMVYHAIIWNHCGCHRRVLNMTHFQLFAWFIQTVLVRKIGKKSKLLIWHTFAPKNNFQWSSWVLPMSPYQIFRGTLRWGKYRAKNVQENWL